DALPRVDLGLAVQRQVIEVLGDGDMGQKTRTGDPFVDGARWRRRLHDGRTLAAGELRADVTDDLEVFGNELELFRHILADLLEHTAAVGTGARRRVDHALPRQRRWQRPPHRWGPWRRCRRGFGGRRACRQAGFQLLDDQFQLHDAGIVLLGAPTELDAPQPRDL